MKVRFINAIIFVTFFTILSCKTKRIHIHIAQEFVSLKLDDAQTYRYLYYNLNYNSFTYNFNKGKYVHMGKVYTLYPDSIDNNNYDVTVKQQVVDSIGKKTKIVIETNISGDYLSQYQLIIYNNYTAYSFKGIRIDTVFNYLNLKSFRIKIKIPDRYVNGSPSPSFISINTKAIAISQNTNCIYVKIPIDRNVFFYSYQKEITLTEDGMYWIKNGKKVLMRDELK